MKKGVQAPRLRRWGWPTAPAVTYAAGANQPQRVSAGVLGFPTASTLWSGFSDFSVDGCNGLAHPKRIVTIESNRVADKVVLRVSGRMDAENAPEFEKSCESWISQGVHNLVVDAGELAYVSSMGLRSFMAIGK